MSAWITYALQWGRDRAVAEIYRSNRAPYRALPAASMGPRPRGRGIGAGIEYPADADVGFNGAATARSRNWTPNQRRASGSIASMGPRPRGRGIGCARWRCGLAIRASMGPRPRGRGIMYIIPAMRIPVLLQWGRDRAVAEFRKPRRHRKAPPSLQWGRDRAVAEFTAGM